MQHSPLQFQVCAVFQLSIDFAIMLQRIYYGAAMPVVTIEEDDLEEALVLALADEEN
ncbi:hypothetical protein FIBSPDRAFT_854722 [Athelia psychrophila]|uniref:Uncharacterized protein n=1 Tax=Athelia psychrophila TaxID=1759441 RepID=A0A166Q1L7_9AGAM|nr:hypothetical protein FIBSPDRAFT_854722 [Fibularhizoctonia sp. CBS 109695]